MWILRAVDDVPASGWNRFTHACSTLTAATPVLLLLLLQQQLLLRLQLLLLKRRFAYAQRTITYIYIHGHGHPPPSRYGTKWPALLVLSIFRSQPNDHMATQHHYLHTSWAFYK